MRSIKIIAVLGAALALTACNQTTRSNPVLVPQSNIAVPRAQPLVLDDVTWQVYNRADIKRLLELDDLPENFVIIAVTPDGYRNLHTNLIEIRRYIEEQQEVIVYLRRVIDNRSQPLDVTPR